MKGRAGSVEKWKSIEKEYGKEERGGRDKVQEKGREGERKRRVGSEKRKRKIKKRSKGREKGEEKKGENRNYKGKTAENQKGALNLWEHNGKIALCEKRCQQPEKRMERRYGSKYGEKTELRKNLFDRSGFYVHLQLLAGI